MNRYLLAAGVVSLAASILHVAIIFGGAEWYRFFGAPAGMVTLAEQGSILPTFSTSGISFALFLWALYAFSGAGLIRRLPLVKPALVIIACICLTRGLALFPVIVLKPEMVNSVILWSSVLCMVWGGCLAVGVHQVWSRI